MADAATLTGHLSSIATDRRDRGRPAQARPGLLVWSASLGSSRARRHPGLHVAASLEAASITGGRFSTPTCSGRSALGAALSWHAARPGSRALFMLPAVLFTVAVVDLPDAVRLLHRLARLESELVRWAALRRLRQPAAAASAIRFYWNALANMIFYCGDGARRICDRLRPGAAPECRHPRPKFFRVTFLLPFMLSPGRGELDDRQVAAGVPLRPGRDADARSSAGIRRPSSPRPGSRVSRSRRSTPGCRFPS